MEKYLKNAANQVKQSVQKEVMGGINSVLQRGANEFVGKFVPKQLDIGVGNGRNIKINAQSIFEKVANEGTQKIAKKVVDQFSTKNKGRRNLLQPIVSPEIDGGESILRDAFYFPMNMGDMFYSAYRDYSEITDGPGAGGEGIIIFGLCIIKIMKISHLCQITLLVRCFFN